MKRTWWEGIDNPEDHIGTDSEQEMEDEFCSALQKFIKEKIPMKQSDMIDFTWRMPEGSCSIDGPEGAMDNILAGSFPFSSFLTSTSVKEIEEPNGITMRFTAKMESNEVHRSDFAREVETSITKRLAKKEGKFSCRFSPVPKESREFLKWNPDECVSITRETVNRLLEQHKKTNLVLQSVFPSSSKTRLVLEFCQKEITEQ